MSMKKLVDILDELITINEELITEESIMQAELADRKAKNLKGEAEIIYYNEWMEKAGLKHLCVQRKS